MLHVQVSFGNSTDFQFLQFFRLCVQTSVTELLPDPSINSETKVVVFFWGGARVTLNNHCMIFSSRFAWFRDFPATSSSKDIVTNSFMRRTISRTNIFQCHLCKVWKCGDWSRDANKKTLQPLPLIRHKLFFSCLLSQHKTLN